MPEPERAGATEIQSRNGAALSDDEMSALAEQLAEAKHEEAQAEAEERAEAEVAAAEPFVEAAELDELERRTDMTIMRMRLRKPKP